MQGDSVFDPSRANGRVVTVTGYYPAFSGDHKWVARKASGGIDLWAPDPPRVLDKACKSFLRRNLNADRYEVFRIPEKYRVPLARF